MDAAANRWLALPGRGLALAALLMAALLSGCLGSKNPITPVDTAQIDERLLGAWVTTDMYYNETDYVHVMRRSGGIMTIHEIRYYGDGSGSHSSVQGNVSILGERRFLNLQGPPDAGGPEDAARYTFVAYEFNDGGDLIVHLLSGSAIGEAFEAGRLEGRVDVNPDFVATLVSDSSEHIAEYLHSTDTSVLYEREVTFRRVVAPQ
jgi:hypothetical protein